MGPLPDPLTRSAHWTGDDAPVRAGHVIPANAGVEWMKLAPLRPKSSQSGIKGWGNE